MNQQEVTILQEEISHAVVGSPITVSTNSAHDKVSNTDSYWCALWNKGELMFTVNSMQQWVAIYNAFQDLFSAPTEATIIAMFVDSEDCIF